MKRLALIVLGLAVVGAVGAQQIGTRAQLNSLLVGGGTLDDFERYNVADGGAEVMGVWSLDSNTIVNGQGPGLVNPGATYLDTSQSNLQWNGRNYFGQPSRDILSNGGGMITIRFDVFTQAFGLDLNNFVGYAYTGQVRVFNGTNMVGSGNIALTGGNGENVFFGWRNDAGIDRVEVFSGNYSWSPLIDNHQYGVVPEPASALAVVAGLVALARRRRRV